MASRRASPSGRRAGEGGARHTDVAGSMGVLPRPAPRAAAQREIPVAVADTNVTAAERLLRAIIELISGAAFTSTIRTQPDGVELTMSNELRRLVLRGRPVSQRPRRFSCGRRRYPNDTGKQNDSSMVHEAPLERCAGTFVSPNQSLSPNQSQVLMQETAPIAW